MDTNNMKKKIEDFIKKCKENGITCCFKKGRNELKDMIEKFKEKNSAQIGNEATESNSVQIENESIESNPAQNGNEASATNSEVSDGSKIAKTEEQRKLVVEMLKNKDQILDSKNLSNMYRSIAGRPEEIKDVITARIQSSINMLRELKGKPLNKDELFKVYTDMKLIKLVCEHDRIDLSTIVIDRNVIEGKAYREPKSLQSTMEEMAELCAENGSYSATDHIDKADETNNITSDLIEKKIEEAEKGDEEALWEANNLYESADSVTKENLKDVIKEANENQVPEYVQELNEEQELPEEDQLSGGIVPFIIETVGVIEMVKELTNESPVMEMKDPNDN